MLAEHLQIPVAAGPSGVGHGGVDGETRFNHAADIAGDFLSFSTFSNVGQIAITGIYTSPNNSQLVATIDLNQANTEHLPSAPIIRK